MMILKIWKQKISLLTIDELCYIINVITSNYQCKSYGINQKKRKNNNNNLIIN